MICLCYICSPLPPFPTAITTNFSSQALAAATALVESDLSSDLKKFLKSSVVKKELTDELGVLDSKLGLAIREKLGITVSRERPLP